MPPDRGVGARVRHEASGPFGRIISPATGERRVMLRAAVIQVVSHLVVRAVPPGQRVPLFDQATGLLDEAGWGLDELVAAAEPGPARDALLRALGLDEDPPGTTAGG
jgi:hypothetical protein